jgi:hypothetical protein
MTPAELIEFRREKTVRELRSRIIGAKQVTEEKHMWDWNNAPEWLRSNVAVAAPLGWTIELRCEPKSDASPQKLMVVWVKRSPA